MTLDEVMDMSGRDDRSPDLNSLEHVAPVGAFPDEDVRPCWGVYDTWVVNAESKHPPGVYLHEIKARSGASQLVDTLVCGPLHVVAQTRDSASNSWGRLLRWYDEDGVMHQWAMPMSLLEGDSSDVRRELAHQGLKIAPGKRVRELLDSYLKNQCASDRVRCVDRLGWYGDVYVTSGEVVGQADDIVVFQNTSALTPALSVAGTLTQWRDSVSRLASGNDRLMFALSVAFAGPLAGVAGEDSGGFHLRGASSSGKSTALRAAASVWGKPETYMRLWRATTNGLEGMAALHNDGVLILDELGQMDGKEVGHAAYMLANGQGKARASRTGAARQAAHWRLMLLSSGEVSLAALMAEAGKRANAGQEIRLADIEADAGAGMGLFNTLHGYDKPGGLAQAIKYAADLHYGAVGMEWLRRMVADRASLPDLLSSGIRQFLAEVASNDAGGQVGRVARRFALVAMAGELATHYGLTGWPEGQATGAAKTCFISWLDCFGGAGNREERALLSQVRAFFEAHGASRFDDLSDTGSPRIPNRAGFVRGNVGKREFLVLAETFRTEVCKGFDSRLAARILVAAGWITPEPGGRNNAQKPSIPGMGKPRCYVFPVDRVFDGGDV